MTIETLHLLKQLLEASAPQSKTALKVKQPLLAEALSQGWIEQVGKSYCLTSAGEQAWWQHASEAERLAYEEKKSQHEKQLLQQFLVLVQEKKGKPLTQKQQRQYSAALRQKANEQQLVRETKANTYELTLQGQFECASPEERVGLLEKQLTQLRQAWTSHLCEVQKQLQQTLEKHLPELRQELPLLQQAETAFQTLQSLMQQMQPLQALTTLLPQQEQFQSRLQSLEETAKQLRAQLEEKSTALTQEFQRLEGVLQTLRAETLSKPQTPPVVISSPPPEPMPTEQELWQATQAEYRRLYNESFRSGSLVRIPELTDAIRQRFPQVTAQNYANLLRSWQLNDRLVLQVCNNPEGIPRSNEGIMTPNGLLLYVFMQQ